MLAHGILSQMQYAGIAAAAPTWVTDGLIAYWDANNATSYGGSGDTWTDLSGNGYDLTKQGGSVSFTGATGGDPAYFGITDSNFYWRNTADAALAQFAGTDCTILGLVSVPSFSNPGYWAGATVNGNISGTLKGTYRTNIGQSGAATVRNQVWDNVDDAYSATSAATLTTNTFYFLGFTTEWGTGHQAWIDASTSGTPASTGTQPVSPTPNAFAVGHSFYARGDSSDQFTGKISAVMVYNKVLSSEEMTQNYDYITGQY